MRRLLHILTSFALLLNFSNSALAQNTKQEQKLTIGIRGGITFAPTDWDWSETKVFPTFGVATSFQIARSPFHLETGLYYTNRYIYGYDNHSLIIPVLFSYHIPLNENKFIQPFIGPFLSYGFDETDIDGGIRMGIGFSNNHFYANCGYDISTTYGVDEDALFISIGYNF